MSNNYGQMLPPQPPGSATASRMKRISMAPGNIGNPTRGTRQSIGGPRQSMIPNNRTSMASRPSLLPAPPGSHSINGSHPRSSIRNTPSSAIAGMRQPSQQYGPNTTNGLGPGGPGISGMSLTEMMNASAQRVANNRRSYAVLPGSNGAAPNSVSRSQQQQQQQQPYGVYNSGTPNQISTTPNGSSQSLTIGRDPRPLRDKNYISMIQQAIYEYLQSHNFVQETKHTLTIKSLRTPTQKDFVTIFKWLYNNLDPGYKFTKSIENEVFLVLKILHYPYLDTINKSQISAVGGQNWPVYVAMLHWLMELNLTLEVYDSGEYEGAEGGVSEIDQIVNRYVVSCYVSFMNGEDMESLEVQDLLTELDQLQADTEKKISDVQEECRLLEEQGETYNKTLEDIHTLEIEYQTVQNDLAKYESYNANLNALREKWSAQIETIRQEIDEQEKSIQLVQHEKTQLEKKIEDQHLKPEEIDGILAERAKISQAIDTMTERLADMDQIHQQKENIAKQALQELDATINDYMKQIYNTRFDPSSNLGQRFNSDPAFFTISLDSPLSEENLGRPLGHEKRIAEEIRPQLTQYRVEISDKIHQAQDEYIKIQENLDNLNENNIEQQEIVEGLGAKLNASNIEYDTIYETMNSDIAASNSEIETIERRVQELKLDANHGVIQVEQRLKNVSMEYDEMKRQALLTRQAMESELERMINTIIMFKVQVQTALEGYEKFVAEEWASSKSE